MKLKEIKMHTIHLMHFISYSWNITVTISMKALVANWIKHVWFIEIAVSGETISKSFTTS